MFVRFRLVLDYAVELHLCRRQRTRRQEPTQGCIKRFDTFSILVDGEARGIQGRDECQIARDVGIRLRSRLIHVRSPPPNSHAGDGVPAAGARGAKMQSCDDSAPPALCVDYRVVTTPSMRATSSSAPNARPTPSSSSRSKTASGQAPAKQVGQSTGPTIRRLSDKAADLSAVSAAPSAGSEYLQIWAAFTGRWGYTVRGCDRFPPRQCHQPTREPVRVATGQTTLSSRPSHRWGFLPAEQWPPIDRHLGGRTTRQEARCRQESTHSRTARSVTNCRKWHYRPAGLGPGTDLSERTRRRRARPSTIRRFVSQTPVRRRMRRRPANSRQRQVMSIDAQPAPYRP